MTLRISLLSKQGYSFDWLLREPFPYLKTDLNQNYPHNFSDMKIWHFCIDFHCVEQKQSNYIGDALN